MNRYGRRIVVASSHLAAAVIFFGLIFSPEDAGVRTALWALGKFAISCSFMSIYVYASEIFPTNIRNLSIGFCEMMSRVGGILAPYVVVLPLVLNSSLELGKLEAVGSEAYRVGHKYGRTRLFKRKTRVVTVFLAHPVDLAQPSRYMTIFRTLDETTK
ncbi:hypothetical protein Y032_0070g429 [Ancylostoma ceylanicum]|uniref:Major facilitator superfamily (MFS) profile domain-containing protein n=1 Tax=Ancylostoma ceylanicum TaxID=53326 RepID=A0A016TXT6_9BILA|nr:hypothetical protein Y032_0070g429 [Ancylostoma ceylanicum]